MSEQEKEIVTSQEDKVEVTAQPVHEGNTSTQQESKEVAEAPEATHEEEPSHPPLIDF